MKSEQYKTNIHTLLGRPLDNTDNEYLIEVIDALCAKILEMESVINDFKYDTECNNRELSEKIDNVEDSLWRHKMDE